MKIYFYSNKIIQEQRKDFMDVLDSMSLPLKKMPDAVQTFSMVDNDKDFFTFIENDALYISRIRRLQIFAILLPKLVVKFGDFRNLGDYKVRLSFYSYVIIILGFIIYALNWFYLIAYNESSLIEMLSVGLIFIAYFGLIKLELGFIKRKFNSYLKKIEDNCDN